MRVALAVLGIVAGPAGALIAGVLVAGVLVAGVWAPGARAAEVPEVINGFKKIEVTFSQRAEECAINDKDMYVKHLYNRLGEMGIKEDANSIVEARINVAGAPSGLSTCILHTLVRFDTLLGSRNIATTNPAVRQAVDRLGVFPITLWSGGAMAAKQYRLPASGDTIDRAAKSVLEQIDFILERFRAERQR